MHMYNQYTHINYTHNNISPSSTPIGSLWPPSFTPSSTSIGSLRPLHTVFDPYRIPRHLPSHRLRPLSDSFGPFLYKIQTPMHTHSPLVSPRIRINKTTLTSSIKNCHPHTHVCSSHQEPTQELSSNNTCVHIISRA